MTRSNVLEIEPLSPAIGAVLRGVNLAERASDDLVGDIRAALLKHQVIFFEGQDFTPTQQRDFAARFGDLHVHPLYDRDEGHPEIMIIDNHVDNPTDNNFWHTDVTFLAAPAMGAILSAQLLPPSGGDTLWASGIAAYAALSAPWQRMLAGLSAEHDFLKSFPAHRFARTPEEKLRWEQARTDHPPRLHPVVRTHPVSGLQGLFVSEGFTTRIVELSASESDATLRQLFAHLAKPEFTVRWRWR